MSSTNRGGERSKFDYYVTPIPAIKTFLAEASKDFCLGSRFILDPCAGGDKDTEASYPAALSPAQVATIDIREDSRAQHKADYLSLSRESIYEICGNRLPEVIVSNPPFDLALDFIRQSLVNVAEGGCVIMLCRLNFFGSGKRKSFWETKMPYWTYVHSERMSFTKDGRTDSIEYAHLVWLKGSNPKFTKLRVI